MKKSLIYLLLLFSILGTGCEKYLEKLPADSPSDANFFKNEQELILALNACYRELPPQVGMRTDAISDIGYSRNTARFDINALANGTQTSLTGGIVDLYWTNHYRAIAKCNNLLDNMDRAKQLSSPLVFSRIKAEARVLRAYYYLVLVDLYGDVPLIEHLQKLTEAQVPKTPKAQTVAFLLKELKEAAVDLPVKYTAKDIGRVTRGAALALRARTALYNQNWTEAAASANELMNLNAYTLYGSYRNLFTYTGLENPEIIFEAQYLAGNTITPYAQDLGPRIVAGISIFSPTQAMVDSYECKDGLPIDLSPLYDKANPFNNRDPRLDQSIIHDGTAFGGYIFSTNPKDVTTLNITTGKQVANPDVTNINASFTGYCWFKYMDESDLSHIAQSNINVILSRYAEVLLTYAEAKVELNQIDASVLDAINQVRARAYGVRVDEVAKYPAVTVTGQTELRKIIRRERKVELACEGFRLSDIKRWKIADKAMNGYVYGRPKGDFSLMGIPAFDADGLPDYTAYKNNLKQLDLRVFKANRDYIWPIPQKDIDVNKKLTQNPNY